MVLAAGLVVSNSALVKTGTTELGYDALEIVFWRSFAAVPLAVVLAGGRWRIRAWRWVLVRCGFGFGGMWGSFTATEGLGVGEISVLARLQPMFVGIVAPLLLGGAERSGLLVWAATALGLAGCTVLLGPDIAQLDVTRLGYAGVAVGAAASSAVAHTALRALGATDEPRTIVLWFQSVVALIATVLVLTVHEPVALPPLAHVPVLAGVGLLSMLGQLTMTFAYRLDRAARVAAATYAGPVIGFALDAVVWGAVPTWASGLGAVIVVGAGALLAASRELEHRAEQAKATEPRGPSRTRATAGSAGSSPSPGRRSR